MKKTIRRAAGAPALPHSPIRFILYFIKGGYAAAISAMLLFEMAQAICSILIPYSFKGIIDQATLLQEAGNLNWQNIWPSMQSFIGFSLGVLIFSRISGTVHTMTGPRLRRKTRAALYHYLQEHSQRFYMENFAGSLANRINEVSKGMNMTLWIILFDFLPISMTFVVSIGILYTVHPEMTLAFGAWILAFVFVSFFLAKRCRMYSRRFAAARSMVTGKIVDAVTNVMNTKLFSRQDYERAHLKKNLDVEYEKATEMLWYMEIMRWFNLSSTLGLQVLMISFSIYVWQKGELTAGAFAMVASMVLVITHQAQNLSRRFLEFFEYTGDVSDGVSQIIRSHEVVDCETPIKLNVRSGEIQFKDVHFSYRDGVPIFQGLNVHIRPGEKVGLVGFSGSGKSSFVNLLLRLFDIQKGEIAIDGQNIAKCTQNSLRKNVSMIPQDPMLFHRSLKENIRYGDISKEDPVVVSAAKKARAHQFVTEQKDGYESLVGERGIKLSGGQRQRIAIARSILKNAPIIVMDEATSSLDSITEKEIQLSLEAVMEGKTVIVVAHRLSTISHLDRILVFHNGEIIEDGSHEELLHKMGHYARLWEMQAGGFLPQTDVSAHSSPQEASDFQ